MTAAMGSGDEVLRVRAGRAAGTAPRGQVVGRHERRPHLVDVTDRHTPPVSRASRASRSRHAARPAWAVRVERARTAAGQVRDWWTGGTERVAARARERWAEQVAARRPTAAGHGRVPTPRATGDGRVPTPRATGDGRVPTSRTTGGGSVPALRSVGGGYGTEAAGGGNDSDTGRPRESEPTTPRHLAAAARSRRAGWHEDVLTGWCSLLLVLGLYLDGWNRRGPLEDGAGQLLTPWHGVLFAALVATAGWILTREQRRRAWSLRAVPPGYRLALVGVGLAVMAVAGDAVWHRLYGEEQGLGRLVSPFHLVLFAGACLLASSTLRAAWSGPSSARVPGLGAFWPVVVSTTLVVAMTACLFQAVSPAVTWRPGLAALPAGAPFAGTAQVYELLGLLVHNLLFVAPVLLLLLRWQTPLGSFTVMAGSVALLLATQAELGLVGLVGAAVLGGAAADAAVSLLRPSPQRRWAARAVAVIAPAVYWTAHFALLRAGYGVTWEPGLWFGSVVWASLSGLTLALLMWPPAVPLTAWNRGRAAAARSTATPTPMPARMVGR
jgi:hypothetical protein